MLSLSHIYKIYPSPSGSSLEVVRDTSLQIPPQKFIAFVGPSGCGKTTLLRLIAGLEQPTAGSIVFNKQEVTAPSTHSGMVFQDSALYPWLTIAENIAFGPRLRGFSEEKIEEIVTRYLKSTGLQEFKNNFAQTISGGMRQRVAVARTLANNPELVLMDEPFGALDSQTRSKLQDFLADIW